MADNYIIEQEIEEAIGAEQAIELTAILQEYKAGKAQTERRIVSSENWWKLRNAREEARESLMMDKPGEFKSSSGWLHNVISAKHADAMEAYPEPNILPREAADKAEAAILSSIIPCIIEQNDFEQTYSTAMWQKLKTGTGAYKIVWDKNKLNGLGDIAIEPINLLNVYWEPGVTDIQDGKYFFHTELIDKDILEETYPQLYGKLKGTTFISTQFLYDDNINTTNKATVIEAYYHKVINGKKTLQYVKYCNDTILYATENIPEMRERGLYDHGLYPYVFDTLFPIEGSPCGYGFVDLCRNPQTEIDLLKTSFVKNAMVGATPRYFRRTDGGINEEEFLDLTKPIVSVNGNLGEDAIRRIEFSSLDGNYIAVLDRTINELRETSGNTETANGSISSGVTAASAIAALQEASGKGSRDANLAAYRAYRQIIVLVIELIRQFYDMPRQFRIVGEMGMQRFVSYSNAGLQPQDQGNAFGIELGYRLPVFDIKVSAQKRSVYTKVTQNELAVQFFQMGFFNPNMVDQALMTLDMMDFDGKDDIMQKIAEQGALRDKLIQYMQLALTFAQAVRPDMVEGLSQDIMMTMNGGTPAGAAGGLEMPMTSALGATSPREDTRIQNARARSLETTQPEGGRITAEAGG